VSHVGISIFTAQAVFTAVGLNVGIAAAVIVGITEFDVGISLALKSQQVFVRRL